MATLLQEIKKWFGLEEQQLSPIKPVPVDDGLVALEKDGDVIRAHPSQVAAWVSRGWSVTD